MVRLALVSIVGALLGCTNDSVFVCSDDAQCPGGSCELSGYCSFPDDACASGQRYGEHAGGGLAGTCVGQMGAETGTSAATPLPTEGPGTASETSGGQTTLGPSCGNGELDGDEECDGAPAGTTCADLGFVGGTLACSPNCELSTAGCHLCGNGMVDADEVCDGSELSGMTCEALGYFAGEATCVPDCSGVDETGCSNCGNLQVDTGEICDGEVLLGCDDLGLGAPLDSSVACGPACTEYDIATCGAVECGVEPPAAIGECPDTCSSCTADTCLLDCTGTTRCSARAIDCPPGWACRIVCDGTNACASATVTCPTFHGCDVECSGTGACSNLQLACGLAGQCTIDCDDSTNVCSDGEVECGADTCTAQCQGGVGQPPNVDCGPSCDCTECA